jgi:hypothetical protein
LLWASLAPLRSPMVAVVLPVTAVMALQAPQAQILALQVPAVLGRLERLEHKYCRKMTFISRTRRDLPNVDSPLD